MIKAEVTRDVQTGFGRAMQPLLGNTTTIEVASAACSKGDKDMDWTENKQLAVARPYGAVAMLLLVHLYFGLERLGMTDQGVGM